MTIIVDRRLSGKNKSAPNRQKFLDRYKDTLRKSVREAVANRKITDIQAGKKIKIKGDLSEPTFRKDSYEDREQVYTGNKGGVKGDRKFIPDNKAGNGPGDNAGDDGFIEFDLSADELMNIFYEDLELPNLVKQSLGTMEEYKLKRAGFVSSGIPSNLNVIRSFKNSIARRVAMGSPLELALARRYEDLFNFYGTEDPSPEQEREPEAIYLKQCIDDLESKLEKIPYIEEMDLKYNHRVKEPLPTTKAVMMCIMDVSGSMQDDEKDIAKRFLMLLYQFLLRQYAKIEIVFVKHREQAYEVDEHDFFNSRPSGGTVVSSGLKLANSILRERYLGKGYNIYIAYAGDGENWNESDDKRCEELIQAQLLPIVQYMCYLQVRDNRTWSKNFVGMMKDLANDNENMAYAMCEDLTEIYPVFRKLFEKQK